MSNTWVTCPRDRDNLSKDGLIPDISMIPLVSWIKIGILKMDLSPIDELAAYQLVGRVKAYQGYDG